MITEPIRTVYKTHGCLGIISLLSGPHLLTIAERTEVGAIRGNDNVIYRVTKTNIHPILATPIALTDAERLEEKNYLAILNNMLETFSFYFSYDFDVTHTEQRISDIECCVQSQSSPLWKRADQRFFWNQHLQKKFIDAECHPFILPIMDGHIKILNCEINSNKFKYIFISRRSCKRAGARYHMRGADPLGNVANFVETEQIVVFDQVLTSYVQTRGSIPLIWKQKRKGLKPTPIPGNNILTDRAFTSHCDELITLYGPQVMVSLIDHHGGESTIGNMFETYAKLSRHANPTATTTATSPATDTNTTDKDTSTMLRYYSFDFHDKCKNNRYENLSELLDLVRPHLDRHGYLFKSTACQAPLLRQGGTFRTNCIDCLDRTNVFQSILAHSMLHKQLSKMGIISPYDRVEDHAAFELLFKNVWADNADVMSQRYTGTAALKTDFTRTGKRSVKGTMTDGVTSVKRYINTNFKDDEKQLALDLFLGKLVVEKWTSDQLAVDGCELDVEYLVDEEERIIVSAVLSVRTMGSTATRCVSLWIPESGRRKDVLLDNIILVERSKHNYRSLNLYHLESATPEIIIFSTSLAREQFIHELYRHGDVGHTPSLRNSNSQTIQAEALDCLVVSINVDSRPERLDVLAYLQQHNIPKDKSVYYIAAQRITDQEDGNGLGGPPLTGCHGNWFYQIRRYFGHEYTMVTTATSPHTAAIVLVHKDLASYISNITVSCLLRRFSNKKVQIPSSDALTVPTESLTPVTPTSSSPPSSPPSPNLAQGMEEIASPPALTSSSTSVLTSSRLKLLSRTQSVSQLFKFGNKLKETGNKPTDALKEYKNKDVQFGTTISFKLKETSVCFVNHCNWMPLSVDDRTSVLYVKNNEYLNVSYRYTFWTGDSDAQSLASSDWQSVAATPSIPSDSTTTTTELSNGIYFKSLPEAEPLSVTSDADSVYTALRLPLLSPYSWMSNAGVPTFIFIKSLVADQFDLLPPGTRLDAYLEFNALHLVSQDNCERTSSVRSTLPVWSESIELRSFIDDKEYLKTQYIQVALVSKELMEYTLVGKGAIPLSNACGSDPTPFKVNLYLEDELACQLQGEVQVFSKHEVCQLVEKETLQKQAAAAAAAAASSEPTVVSDTPTRSSPLLSFIPYFSSPRFSSPQLSQSTQGMSPPPPSQANKTGTATPSSPLSKSQSILFGSVPKFSKMMENFSELKFNPFSRRTSALPTVVVDGDGDDDVTDDEDDDDEDDEDDQDTPCRSEDDTSSICGVMDDDDNML
ncbi:hypothetical protein SAMD00019534_025530 [Acytostelium subglobosum LB1]|uniref:hypothetical protein n=1 Tax=Acytostelium subglobosum LB1 TaxID=1410327 RepID=UPI0006447FE3|nr:hypothetical protein SAMD00019534_025530 [Acytostelium subglobosum LB1]GAM19378.1 hypothetical protein SAMD00019534_025530 [Acytostelium subglobosum LB1]|eukprot:XP_012757305.1 hypothetical protein SAMD00019534_025530 [Acytostelium subglobosum LB1]